MHEHFHLLMGEPKVGTPSLVLQVLKQRVARTLRGRGRRRASNSQLGLWEESRSAGLRSFWQRRFYDFNVWSKKKKIEKLNYMHMNPVRRGLVEGPKGWKWSSYAAYQGYPDALMQIDFVD
jgi:putative transposase